MKFLEIKFKNFLSYGNNFTVFKFDDGITGIIGKNGEGKSTILSAIYFALTGKPNRDIKKKELINITNNKNCYVELLFEDKGNNYIVKRGIKPDVFEIYKNNELIVEESHVRDYQCILESITGLSTKIIDQVLIISNRFYKPFLELSAADKRSFTDTIFGIDDLSIVVDNIKIRMSSVKQKEPLLEKDLERIESNISLLSDINNNKLIDIQELNNQITSKQEILSSLNLDIETLDKNIIEFNNKLLPLENKVKEGKQLYQKLAKCQMELNRQFEENSICSSCGQFIPIELLEHQRLKNTEHKQIWQSRLDKINNQIKSLEKTNKRIETLNLAVTNAFNQKEELKHKSNSIEKEIINIKNIIVKQQQIDSDNDNKIKKLQKQKKKYINELNIVKKEKQAILLLQKMLSEKGIRNYIFNKYLILLNKTINDKLEILGAKYQVKLNEEFKDQLIGKGYNGLSYGGISVGERQRLDLSIMFAFLEIAKLRNNINCNLLCFDEMFGDIDNDGLYGISKIFENMKTEDKSIILVTHDDRVKGMTDKTYTIIKDKFSKMVGV